MDDIGLKICNFQAQLFEESKDYFNCSSLLFIKRFMNSSLANRMDNKFFVFESRDIKCCYYELNIKKVDKKIVDHFPSYVLSWIGYLYRYACYEYNISSRTIYSIVKPRELYRIYEAYHSLDVNEAIIRIFEAKNIDVKVFKNIDYLTIAKKIYRINAK